ncbi:MAG: 50S ribosomal protein L19e [Candidatus Diapherotrites archaeon]|nr:50S ribosomal protein L19e [Candidatus Micrarchaeota archaeon]MBU1939508.1 50S ribosomal protein L19e [Candidatus Micrarchaeota archaeon]
MDPGKLKRMAAQILKVGKSKVWMNPEEREKISESMTKEDVRGLIAEGLVKKSRANEHSRGMARKLHEKKKKGRKRGSGKRTGTKKARVKKKASWIKNVRAQRKKLAELKKSGVKGPKAYSKMYKMIKGNYFRGKKYLEIYVKGEKK